MVKAVDSLESVDSSNVQGIGYDPDTKQLAVQFKGGAIYLHYDVPPDEHAALMASDSKGGHYHKHFRATGRFRSERLPEGDDTE